MENKTEFNKSLTNFTKYFITFFLILDFFRYLVYTGLQEALGEQYIFSIIVNIVLEILVFKLSMYLTMNSAFKVKEFTNIEAELVKRKIWTVCLAMVAFLCCSGLINTNSRINEVLDNSYELKMYDTYFSSIEDEEISKQYIEIKEEALKEVKQEAMLICLINYTVIFIGDVCIIKLQSKKISKLTKNEEEEIL